MVGTHEGEGEEMRTFRTDNDCKRFHLSKSTDEEGQIPKCILLCQNLTQVFTQSDTERMFHQIHC